MKYVVLAVFLVTCTKEAKPPVLVAPTNLETVTCPHIQPPMVIGARMLKCNTVEDGTDCCYSITNSTPFACLLAQCNTYPVAPKSLSECPTTWRLLEVQCGEFKKD